MSAGAEAGEQFATGALIERVELDAAVALVAEHFDEGRPALFLWRL
jgi:hypothetical protein